MITQYFLVLILNFIAFTNQIGMDSKEKLIACISMMKVISFRNKEQLKEGTKAIMGYSSKEEEDDAKEHFISFLVLHCYQTNDTQLITKYSHGLTQKKIDLKTSEMETLFGYTETIQMFKTRDTKKIIKLTKDFKEINEMINSEDFNESSFYSTSGDLGLLGFSFKDLTSTQKNLIGLVLFLVLGGIIFYLLSKLLKKDKKEKKKKKST